MARNVTENRDGSFTVVQDGQTYHVPANDSLGRQESLRAEANAGKSLGGNVSNASSGGSNSGGSSGGSSSGSSSGGGNYSAYDKNTNVANEKAYLNSQLEQARQSGNKGLEDWALRQLNNLSSYESTQAYLNSQSIGSGTYGGGGGGLGGSVVSDNSQLFTGFENQMNGYLQQLQDAKNANDKALQAAIEAAIRRLEQQKPEILRNAENANTAAYNAYTQASNPFGIGAESAAAIGLGNSGYAESSMVNLGNTYQNALNQNEQSKLDLLSDLEEAKRQALLTGDIERANAAAEYAQLMAQYGYQNANAIMNARLQLMQMDQQEAQRNWSNQFAQEQWNYEKENDAYNKAWQLASTGYSSQKIADILGMTLDELNRLIYVVSNR